MNRRALTLIEVLAATVLLSIMVAAVLPTLTAAMAKLSQPTQLNDLFDVATCADAFMADPASFEFEDLNDALKQEVFEFSWQDAETERVEQVYVRLLRPDNFEARHAWLAFTLAEDDGFVLRWVALPPKPERSTP